MTNELDYQVLDKLLDKTKSAVFLSENAAFFGSLMCSLNFIWSEDIETACTNGLTIQWNPHWFLKLDPEVRKTVLMHELWHVAKLDMIRCGVRAPRIWNYACDIVINNGLEDERYSFKGTTPWLDQKYRGWASEDVYDELINQIQSEDTPGIWGSEDEGDLVQPDPNQEATEHTIVSNVVAAATAATMSGGKLPGDGPGSVETILKRFLQPKLPWEQLLFNFFNDLYEQDYTWARPNRRYHDMYLPSLQSDGGLEHLIYYLDVSGSVSDAEVTRFNSEVKYIKDTFNPLKLTLVLFDTVIQREYVFNQEDPFEEVVVVGRGGTSLVCVREHMLEHNPTAAIVFSDMYCTPMEPIPQVIPVIWVCINNGGAQVPFGKLIHIRE